MGSLTVESNFLGPPEPSLNRSTSEPDIFAVASGTNRQRTCSNASQIGKQRLMKTRASTSSIKTKNSSHAKDLPEINLDPSTPLKSPTQAHNGHVTPSRAEVKAQAYERLQEELQKAQLELKLKDEQCEKLSRIRNELESELEELTASLFQEAHAMVHDAKLKQVTAEKRYQEADNKVDLLQAEVQALKSLLISKPPKKTQRWRRHSDENLAPCVECGSYDCDGALTACGTKRPRGFQQPDDPEVDVILFREFLEWMDERSVSHDQPFLSRIYREDVAPCLNFTNKELALAIHRAVENNTLSMETIRSKAIFRKCALTGASRFCRHRVKLSDGQDWINVCRTSRDRIAAVCDFYMYVRYIQRGLVKADVPEIYWEIMRLRSKMALARLGLPNVPKQNSLPRS